MKVLLSGQTNLGHLRASEFYANSIAFWRVFNEKLSSEFRGEGTLVFVLTKRKSSEEKIRTSPKRKKTKHFLVMNIRSLSFQATFTCSKLTIVTVEQVVNMLKLTIKTPERRWRRSRVFIVNIEHISHLFLLFLLITLNM